MKVPHSFIATKNLNTCILASKVDKIITCHLLDLPVLDNDGFFLDQVHYLCKIGSECVFCKQHIEHVLGNIGEDVHVKTVMLRVLPVYDLLDNNALKLVVVSDVIKTLPKVSLTESSGNYMSQKFDIDSAGFTERFMGSTDRANLNLPLLDNWELESDLLDLEVPQDAIDLRDNQLAQLIKRGLSKYDIDFLRKREYL